ncbi:hypothetical protein AUJ14_04035 [Candidatus Micrarchaeota archaeon CG1_02_55_22]|nr:MAG: hypothetical protein AUJ14_04035 [Candidatus Micrarchaeota archaeon CG1_02_55_22]
MIFVYRMIWLKLGGRRFHLLKLAGSFFVFAFVLKALEAAYTIFVTVNKAIYANANPALITPLFGWSINAPAAFTSEDIIGVLLGPVANFLFWMALAVAALMIYQAGKIVFPIEEYEQKVSEHHRKLIAHARVAHAKLKRK